MPTLDAGFNVKELLIVDDISNYNLTFVSYYQNTWLFLFLFLKTGSH